jgi:16S rRNA (uracil1498-N3)-methyltransferase
LRRARVADLHAGAFALDAATSHWLANVLGLSVGAKFQAFSGYGREGDAEVIGASGYGLLQIRILSVLTNTPQATTLMLVQALPKGPKLDAIVQDATELGASHI